MSFVLGGTSGSSSLNLAGLEKQGSGTVQSVSLIAFDEYVVSPRKAKITFTGVAFEGALGRLGYSSLDTCTVTYDRSLSSGSTLLNCPFTAPVGDIYQIQVLYDNTLQMLVSDAATGIYSNPSSATGFATSAPASGAGFVPFTGGGGSNSIGNRFIPSGGGGYYPIVLQSPISIVAGSTPTLYITIDMIHTFQLRVDAGGTTLSLSAPNGWFFLFGGPTPGSSTYYSNANTIEAFKAGTIGPIAEGLTSVRVFYDQAGTALFLLPPSLCAPRFLQGAWATPATARGTGGWLGTDASKNLAWALPAMGNFNEGNFRHWSVYSSYYVMAEQTVIGQTTVLKCKATASPPAPADGKTYASGAPAMPSPDKSVTLTLLAK